MIVTVTMNPAIDKTVEIETLIPGGLNRIRQVEYDAGGKGINVSKTIRALGGTSIATGFLGGSAGKMIENVLKEQEIEHHFIWMEGETRINTKVHERNGSVTELNEPGPVISEEKCSELCSLLLELAGPETLFVLAGSIPGGMDPKIYGEIIRLVHGKGAKVLLDADGQLFRNALEAGPDMIKPNRAELEGFMGTENGASEKELLAAAKRLKETGIESVTVSMGGNGAMLLLPGFEVRCPALSVKAQSTVGAGDAMVAAMAYSWDKKLSPEETVRFCMAASAGAVTTVGTKPPTRELVDTLKEQVMMEQIGEETA